MFLKEGGRQTLEDRNNQAMQLSGWITLHTLEKQEKYLFILRILKQRLSYLLLLYPSVCCILQQPPTRKRGSN